MPRVTISTKLATEADHYSRDFGHTSISQKQIAESATHDLYESETVRLNHVSYYASGHNYFLFFISFFLYRRLLCRTRFCIHDALGFFSSIARSPDFSTAATCSVIFSSSHRFTLRQLHCFSIVYVPFRFSPTLQTSSCFTIQTWIEWPTASTHKEPISDRFDRTSHTTLFRHCINTI